MNISSTPKPKTLEELETQLLQSLDRGEGIDGEDALCRFRKWIKESRSDA